MTHWREFLDPSTSPGGYLRWAEVARRTSLSRTTAWRLQKRDEFPRPYSISPGRVGHLQCEVDAWIASRAQSRGAEPRPTSNAEATPLKPKARRSKAPQVVPASPPPSPPPAGPAALPQPVRSAQAGRRARGARPTARTASQQISFNF